MPQPIHLKDPGGDSRIFIARTLFSALLVLALMGMILARYYDLQINDYEIYRTQSERNRVQLQSLPPKRGLIYDRNGVLLADNRPSHILSIIRERVDDLDATLGELQTLLPISESDLENFQQKLQRRPKKQRKLLQPPRKRQEPKRQLKKTLSSSSSWRLLRQLKFSPQHEACKCARQLVV
ncbi:MAG: hypothetical protein NWS56_03080 [Haliea sp.]|nr:hypothetical protein [Haliea sp.]